MEETFRRAARVLLVDEERRLLLFRGRDGARAHTYWFTPGGGLEPGEPAADGAARELAEETGLAVPAADLGPVVHRETVRYPFEGRWYVQRQEFFLLRTAAFPVRTDGFDEVERRSVIGYRWWRLPELATAPEPVYPAGLAGLAAGLLGGGRC